jgi:hypothetical protein
MLVRWSGRDASGDTGEPLERLTNGEAALVAAFEPATSRALPRPAPPPGPPPAAAAPPPPHSPTLAGFTIDAALPGPGPGGPGGGVCGLAAALLVAGRWLAARRRRPSEARRLCPCGAFSHKVAYTVTRHSDVGRPCGAAQHCPGTAPAEPLTRTRTR